MHITANLTAFNLTINLCYVPSAQNEVDILVEQQVLMDFVLYRMWLYLNLYVHS